MAWCLFKAQGQLLTPRNRVLLEKLTVAQLVKKFPTFYRTQGSFSYSQKPATGPYPELFSKHSTHTHTHTHTLCCLLFSVSIPVLFSSCTDGLDNLTPIPTSNSPFHRLLDLHFILRSGGLQFHDIFSYLTLIHSIYMTFPSPLFYFHKQLKVLLSSSL
jgi:hypothetical protein